MLYPIEDWPIPPDTPCPFCGKTFPSIRSTYSHFKSCDLYHEYMKTHNKWHFKAIAHSKKWLPYFYPKLHQAVLDRKLKKRSK